MAFKLHGLASNIIVCKNGRKHGLATPSWQIGPIGLGIMLCSVGKHGLASNMIMLCNGRKHWLAPSKLHMASIAMKHGLASHNMLMAASSNIILGKIGRQHWLAPSKGHMAITNRKHGLASSIMLGTIGSKHGLAATGMHGLASNMVMLPRIGRKHWLAPSKWYMASMRLNRHVVTRITHNTLPMHMWNIVVCNWDGLGIRLQAGRMHWL